MRNSVYRYLGHFYPAMALVSLFCAAIIGASSLPAFAKHEIDEEKMGREAAAELEKQYKVLNDEALQARVDKIGQELANIANSEKVPALYGTETIKPFKYVFKILDDKDVNALSMPGGFVYLNKGLIDYAQSDDELAGVIAHEISHISHHHMVWLVKEQAKMNNQIAIALLAAILTGTPTGDMGNIMMGARFIQIAKLNGYSRKAEEDADMTGLAYLSKSRYNPVGMLTFMERLARDEMGRPSINWGIYQTHPYPGDRSRAITSRLTDMKVSIDRRAVSNFAKVEVKPAEGKPGVFEVWLGGKRLFTPASDVKTSEERAKALAAELDRLFESGITMRDIKQTQTPAVITCKGAPLIVVTDADAALFAPKSPGQIAREAYGQLYQVLLDQELNQIY